ncbi:MAG: flagellar biosynthesis anti-sigma factor FlgM [Sedimentisphaerales bacterium]|nr:flagellar biosynthesis anti-sigma factor FlgM [Sedimentisphaerales bacterium]
MNNINGINSYNNLPPIGKSSDGNIKKNHPIAKASQSGDQVQISEVALYLSKIANLPEIRQDLVDEVKQALDSGTYDIEGKLSIAIDNLLDEHAV